MKCKYCDNEAKWITPMGDGEFLCEKHSATMSEILEAFNPTPTPPEPPKPDSEGSSEGGHHPWPWPWPWPWWDNSEGVK